LGSEQPRPSAACFKAAASSEDDGAFGDHLRNYFLRLLNYPGTSSKTCGEADKRLKSGQFTYSDDEIDVFLRTELRKNKPKL
jgi:hypothetical protein